MKYITLLIKKTPYLLGITALLSLTSCGSFQYVNSENDGIYGEEPSEQVIIEDVSEDSSNYYSNYFREKSNEVDIDGETIIDAQIGYDFGEAGFESLAGLSIFLQAQNLTEEPFTSRYSEGRVKDYQDYGSTYLLGFSYKL